MRKSRISFTFRLAALLIGTVMALPVAALAGSFSLCAGEGTVTMPDGKVISVWGFAQGGATGGVCDNPVSVPGPEIRDNAGGTLSIILTNTLAVPVSIMIPGLVPDAADVTPTWIDASGNVVAKNQQFRPADVTSRARSFVKEVDPGTSATYTWPAPRNGTFLYESGTHPQVQVQMGLYGALIYESTPGTAYAGIGNDARTVTYDADQVLLFSEFDVETHEAVAGGNYGPGGAMTSTIDYEPDYYLINGQPYAPSRAPMNIAAIAGQTVLLRLLNAGLDNVVPTVQGAGYLAQQAEDGFGYPYARSEYSVDLPAGKTVDATFTAPASGYIAVYDRRLNLAWKGGGAKSGGQLVYLGFGTEDAILNVTKVPAPTGTLGDGTVKVASMPGGFDCPVGQTACSASYVDGTMIRLTAQAVPGSAFKGWSGACSGFDDCVVTLSNAVATDVSAIFKQFTKVKVMTHNTAGIKLTAGDGTVIHVGAPANAVYYRYLYSTNNGATWKRITRKVTDSHVAWLIPDLPAKATQARIRVDVYDASKTTLIASDVNNQPMIIKVVKLLTPKPGDTLVGGGSIDFVWSTHTTTKVGAVKLQYRKRVGKPWVDIVTLNGNPGSYTWSGIPTVVIPKTDTSVRVRLYDTNGNLIDGDQPDGFLNYN
ncbi:hypothetical protein EDC39_11357 [Geothermobacter ehrlichii]|uniref:Bacterial repeat domain-containing protein n=1 Tax=Geothermobacter ehrlichii TaxID=213224 RepID=A0A5D3WHX2_9BACT|nr:hypothetical protein [Geothermobacter ehrlichii]TYO96667.1 hypothetical protein EDC39_11357 [Geothermobacter ehrlichii]